MPRFIKYLPSIGFLLALILSIKLLFPFYLALASVWVLSPITEYLHRHSRLSRRSVRLVLLSVLLLFLVFLSGVLIRAILRESEGFFTSLYEALTMAARSLYAFVERLKTLFHVGDLVSEEKLSEIASSLLTNAASALSENLASLATAAVKALPKSVLATVFYLLSLVYIALDYEKVRAVLQKLTPKPLHIPFKKLKASVLSLFRHLFRAYGILFGITFTITTLAFFLMRIDYPVWWALLAASLDALPAIGIGIILIPWGIGLLLAGQTAKGVLMLVLYAALTVLRQVLEPRVLGRELGVPSLVSLLSLYLGFTLFGGWGILLSPLLSILFTRLYRTLTTHKAPKGTPS